MSSKQATQVQRVWRGHRCRRILRINKEPIERIRGRAYSRLGPYGHITVGGGYVKSEKKKTLVNGEMLIHLNEKDEFWSGNVCREKTRVVGFSNFLETKRIGETQRNKEKVIFGTKVSKLFAKVIKAEFDGELVYPLFSSPSSSMLTPYFNRAIEKLESGRKFYLMDKSLSKITSTDLWKVKSCFTKYKYFMENPCKIA